ncbi:hypothetical protein FA15DRAFT_691050 [Coprinopsis marcescibilis]|uniref:TPR-like protein n=1 Tax=Coprinopsis marcescibilis TaxID=230819 RepID=A0A5C3LBR8_COPMA|nr:hypothetical protein FA15DRAFT_691050 [Coprinopsis marcescibilis]
MDKLLRNTLSRWMVGGLNPPGLETQVLRDRTQAADAEPGPVRGPLAGLSNLEMQDSAQINFVGGNMSSNITNITNVTNIAHNESLYYTDAAIHEALRRLPDPVGCSWSASATCLEGTREAYAGEIMSWMRSPGGATAEVYVVADSAGSGKSALAHTICQKAEKERILVAGFFFNQMNQKSTTSGLIVAFIRGLCDINDQIKRHVGEILSKNSTLASADPIRQFEDIVLPVSQSLPPDRHFVIVIDALDEEHDPVILYILRDWVPRLPSSFRILLMTRPEERVMKHLGNQPHIRHFSSSLTGVPNYRDLETFIVHRLSTTDYGSSVSQTLLQKFVERTEGLFLWARTVLNHLDNASYPVEELEDIVSGSSAFWEEDDAATKQLDNLYLRVLANLKWADRRFVEMYRKIIGALVTLKEPLSPTGLAALYAPDGLRIEDIHRLCSLFRTLLQDYSPNSQQPVRLLHLSVQEFLTQRAPLNYRLNIQEHHSKLSHLSLITIKKDLTPLNVPVLGYTEGEWFIDPFATPPKMPSLEKYDFSEQLYYSCRQLEYHTLIMPTQSLARSHIQLAREVIVEGPRAILEVTAALGSVVDVVSLRKLTLTLSSENLDASTMRKTAAIYCAMARILAEAGLNTQGLPLAHDAAALYRQVSSETNDPGTKWELCEALQALSSILHSLRFHQECYDTVQEGLQALRPLVDTDPATFRPRLSKMLRICSLASSGLKRHEDAIRVARENADISRQLAVEYPNKWSEGLARALYNLAFVCSACQRVVESIPPIVECIEIVRPLAITDPFKFDQFLSDSLYNYSLYIYTVGQSTNALEPAQESIDICRRLSARNPDKFNPHLVRSLQRYGFLLSQTARHAEALEPTLEAIIIQRQLTAKDSSIYEPQLSDLVYNHAYYISNMGRHAEAAEIGKEALDIRRRLAAQDPERHEGSLGSSLSRMAYDLLEAQRSGDVSAAVWWQGRSRQKTYGYYLYKVGKHAEALEHTREALEIRRSLAAQDPLKFEPSVGWSLQSLGRYFNSCNRFSEGLPFLHEAVEVRRRLAARDPAVYEGQLAQSLHNHLYCISNVGKHAEGVVVGEAAVEVCRYRATKDPTAFEDNLASALYWLAYNYGELGREEEAVPLYLEAISIYRRLTARDTKKTADLAWALFRLACLFSSSGRNEDAILPVTESIDIRRRLYADNPTSYGLDLSYSLNKHAIFLSDLGNHVDAVNTMEEAVGMYRGLAARDPLLYEEPFAGTLQRLAYDLGRCERYGDAVVVAFEGLEVRRRLAERGPGSSEGQLAEALQYYGYYLSGDGRDEEAVEPVEEAISIRRRLAAKDPGNLEDLTWPLWSLAHYLNSIGRSADAIPPMQECVEILHQLVAANGSKHEPRLADALTRYSRYVFSAGKHLDALLPVQEAIDIRRRLATEDPEQDREDLACSLEVYAGNLERCKRYDEAIAVGLEVVKIRRSRVQKDPSPDKEVSLCSALDDYAQYLSSSGRHADAVKPGRESIAIRRGLVAQNLKEDDEDFAYALNEHAWILAKAGMYHESIACGEESVSGYRRLANSNPDHLVSVGNSLDTLAHTLNESQRYEEALARATEGLQFCRQVEEGGNGDGSDGDHSNLDDPTSSLHQRCAVAFFNMGRKEDSVKHIQQAIHAFRRLMRGDEPEEYEKDLEDCLHLLDQVNRMN